MVRSDQDPNYQQCKISIMDNIADPTIVFDEKGICNYYYEHLEAAKDRWFRGEEGEKKLREAVELMKEKGKDRDYDCIIGVSGGVDSTYLCYLAKKLNLRALCVHFDNGWNSELAVANIQQIVERCGFDLFTYVINWEEFKDIQLAYFKAGVIDIEAVTDIAIFNALDMICAEKKIGYILEGSNIATESTLPRIWTNKNPNNLFDIHSRFGTRPLKEYPAKFKKGKYIPAKGSYQGIQLLNYVEYDKKKVKEIIAKELGWRDYGGKHYESVFTRFYQGYILPEKFKVDKRKAHLSNLIFSGQLTKEEAQEELKQPIYPAELFQKDHDFVLKKLGISVEEFKAYMDKPQVSHSDFRNEQYKYVPGLSTRIKGKIKSIFKF